MPSNNQYAVFSKKLYIPWYDSGWICGVMIGFMIFVFLFGITGIFAARENIEYHPYTWVPLLLVLMSGTVITKTTLRLIRRYTYKIKNED